MEPKKYQYIDSLRGIAILMVILVHTGDFFGYLDHYGIFFPDKIAIFIMSGKLGVQLFFVVSAFTLMLSHQSRKEERHATRNFFIRRFFRIAPLFYLIIIYYSFLPPLMPYNAYQIQTKTVGLVSSLFFVNGLIPSWINTYVPGGWSIAIEFMFYFSLPFLCKKIKNLNASIVLVLLSLLASTIFPRLVLPKLTSDGYFLYYNFTAQLPVFALGIMAYWFVKSKTLNLKGSTMMLLAGTIFFYCYTYIPYQFLYGLIFATILLMQNKKSYKILSNKVLAQIGKVSFSIYLIHFIFIYWLREFHIKHFIKIDSFASAALDFVLFYLLILTLAFCASWLTYRYIEVPGQTLGKKLIQYLDKRETRKNNN